MAITDYASLQAAIADTLNRADLTSAIPSWISLAEAQMMRRLMKDGPVREMMGRSDATILSEFTAVPTDFLGPRAMFLAANYKPLAFVEPEEIVSRKTLYPNTSGDPLIWSVVGPEFQVWPWNSGSFSAELTYWKSVAPLSNSNTTNWLLTKHPDAYLYTSLIQSAPYLKDDERLAVWSQLAATILGDVVAADKLSRTSTNLAVHYVPGGTP